MNAMLKEVVMEDNIVTRFARVVLIERSKKPFNELKAFAEELLEYALAYEPEAEEQLISRFRQMFKTDPILPTSRPRSKLTLHRPRPHDNIKTIHAVRVRH